MASHIAVIEDDPALQDLYRVLLEAEGYKVTISSTTYKDVSTIVELHPDLIILDLFLGRNQNGGHFLQLLRSSPLTSTIPVVIATATATIEQEWAEFAQFKEIPVILKPFSIDAVLSLVHQILADTPDAVS